MSRLLTPRALAATFAVAVVASLVMIPIPWGDSSGAVFGPISLLCEGDLDLDEFPFLYERTPRGEHVADPLRTVHPDPSGQRLLSFTGLGVKLAGVPAAAALVQPWWGVAEEIRVVRASQLTVAWTAALILLLIGSTLRRIAGPRIAVLGAGALFFGTTLWPQLRQTPWSNQVALVGVAALIYVAYRARDEGLTGQLAILAGAATGWAVMSRAATAVVCLPLLVAMLIEARRRGPIGGSMLRIVLAGLPFAGLLALDNVAHTGHPLRFTFLAVASDIGAAMGGGDAAFSGSPLTGLAGLLVSPSRGLLVFSPFLALALPGALRALRSRDPLGVSLIVGVVAVLGLNAGYVDWWGASCWGPRRLMDIVPSLVVLGVLPEWRSGAPSWLRRLGPMLLAWSVAVQAVGFFAYDSRWDARHEPTANMVQTAEGLRYDPSAASAALWSVRDGVLVDALRRLPEQGLQFGRDLEFTFAVGDVVPAPLPACSILRGVDRFPRPAADPSTEQRIEATPR